MCNRANDLRNLTGKILLITPNVSDVYIPESMVLVCKHTKKGAMGVVINKPLHELGLLALRMQCDIEDDLMNVKLYTGGNQNLETCYILHTNRNLTRDTFCVKKNLYLTTSDDLVEAINFINQDPERKIICLGCYFWEAAQLEKEILSNLWVPIDADEALIFGYPSVDKWSKAFLKIGLNASLLLDKFGTA